MAGIRELAARTPAHRVRYLDLLRAGAILAVVLGHWLIVAIAPDPTGRLTGTSALAVVPWSHPITWLFQVMPVFFLVGGYVNTASLASFHRRGRTTTDWLLARGTRLIAPTTGLLLALATGAMAARVATVDPDQLGRAIWLATIPLWFLVVYLAVVGLTPLARAWYRRAGWAAPGVLAAAVAIGDGLRLTDRPELAYGSYLFAWLAIYLVGMAWEAGRLPQRAGPAAAVAATGLVGLLLLTVVGPYPVSMVTVPGAGWQNTAPPSLALLVLTTTQLGLVLLLRPLAERWLTRRRLWQAVVAVNTVVLTVFLWHMVAAVIGAGLLAALGWLPTTPVGSGAWLALRLPWLATLSVVLLAVVAVVGRIETADPVRTSPRPAARWGAAARPAALTGYAAAVGGLLGIAVSGPADHGPVGLPAGALALYLCGALLLLLFGWLRPPLVPGRDQQHHRPHRGPGPGQHPPGRRPPRGR